MDASDMEYLSGQVPDEWHQDPATWTTANGDTVLVSDMTDDHLFYAYRKTKNAKLANEMAFRLFKIRVGK